MEEPRVKNKYLWRDTQLLVNWGLYRRMRPLKTTASLTFIRYKERSVWWFNHIVRAYEILIRKYMTVCSYVEHPYFNPLTQELNPSAHRWLTRFFTGDFSSWTVHFVNTCVKNNKYTNYSFSLLIMYGSSYMFRNYIAILRECFKCLLRDVQFRSSR
jgi:hypothetical protein